MTNQPAPSIEYVPGTCNIGAAEVRVRSWIGWFGVIATAVVAFVVLLLDAHPAVMLVAAIPAYIAAIGLLQARAGFCVGYAAAGSYGTGPSLGATGTVQSDESRAADKTRARQLNGHAARVTSVVTVALFAVAALSSGI